MSKNATLALCILLALASGCHKGTSSGVKPSEMPNVTTDTKTSVSTGQVIARFNGDPITDEDIRKVGGSKLAQAEAALYDARKDGIDQIVEDRLMDAEAKKKGTTKDDLLKKNVYDKIKISDKDIEKFYNEKKAQMQGKKLEEAKDNIRGYLFREKYQSVYGDYVANVKKNAKIEVLIKPAKIDIEEGDAPALGPKDAPIRLVEFTDYQCPFCGRARAVINQVLSEYKGKVRYVLKDFPLSFHKDSIKAHEAALCAGDQGKYWDLNKKLWDNQQSIKVDDLKKYAKDVGLNTSKFNECLDSGKNTDKVRQNQQYGEKVGVTGTPAFFINGRMISGARPFDSFKQIIDDELQNAKN